jgi:hypothetical protein
VRGAFPSGLIKLPEAEVQAKFGSPVIAKPRLAVDATVQRNLTRLVQRLRQAGGTNLLGVAVYGSLAKGRYAPGASDLNVLIVVDQARLPDLAPLAPALTAAVRQSQIAAFVATPADLRDAARLFPVMILDIQLHHHLLYGDVHLAGLRIDPAGLSHWALQELKGLEMRLRRRILEHGADPDVLWGALLQGLPKLAAASEMILRARGIAVPSERAELFRLAGPELGADPAPLARLAELRRHDSRPTDDAVRERLTELLDILAGFVRKLDGI